MPPVSEERLAELTDRLESGIKDLYASGRYADYLAAMSKFHSYSYGNALLILFQCPTATNVAGYNTWKNVFDRQVKRGEKGIQILAPCPYQRAAMVEKKDPATGKRCTARMGSRSKNRVSCGPRGSASSPCST